MNLRGQINNGNFDINLYNFEKKRQAIENKADPDQKKIKINFKNSFVNNNTHEKYDKIIEDNNKRNTEKIEHLLGKEMQKVEDVVNLINRVEATNLSNKKIINESEMTINLNNESNTTKNESEMIMIEDISCINKTNKNDDTMKCEFDTENIEEVIEEDIEEVSVDTYDKFLEDTQIPNKIEKEYVHSILRNQMKNIVTSIKERKKGQESIKSEKKKNILLNLQNTNTILDDQMIKDILIKKINLQSSKEIQPPKPEVITFGKVKVNEVNELRKPSSNEIDYGDFINEDVRLNNENNEALDENEVTQINQTVNEEETEAKNDCTNTCMDNTCNDKTRLIESKQLFDMNEFIKENTKDEILVDPEEELQYAEIQQIKSNNNYKQKRFTIGNDDDEEKLRRIQRLKEIKIKELESKREKSKPKISNKNVTKKISKSPKRRPHTGIGIVRSNVSNVTNITTNSNNSNLSNININITTDNTNDNSTISRVPIKIIREEAQAANRKIKSNVNFQKLSNKKFIKSAISNVCLAGEPNRVCREKLVEIIEKCPCENFIILFKGNFGRFDLKAVYTFNSQNGKTELLSCLSNSPLTLDSNMIASYFKYDNTQKDFKLLKDTKEISLIVDAVSLNK